MNRNLDPRSGQIPEIGKTYRVTMVDLEYHERHDEGLVRITAIRPPSRNIEDYGYSAQYFTTSKWTGSRKAGDIASANFYGRSWYRLFREVPPIRSIGRTL